MKLLAFLALSCSAFAVENNARIFFERDSDLQEMIMMEFQGHMYEIIRLDHSYYCPCDPD